MITIITPTYNRAYIIEKAYKSLLNQDDKNFEWLVIDDGSTDDTKKVVQKFIKNSEIDIKYIYKRNGGKHTALNVGIKEAKGELILILDSDDYLTNNAISLINKYWKKYKIRKDICGMTFLRKIANPVYKNKKFNECVDNLIDFKYNQNRLYDMCEVMRTDILKKYPYPEFKDEKFLSEVIVAGEIAKKYDTAYIPVEIYNTEYLEDGLSKNWIKQVVKNPLGARANNLMFMSKRFKYKIRLKNCIMFNVFSFIGNQKIFKDTKMKVESFIVFIPSYFIAIYLNKKYGG